MRDLCSALGAVMDQPRLAVFIDEAELLVPTRNGAGEKLFDYLEFAEILRVLSTGKSNILSILLTSFDPALIRISHWGARQNPSYQLFEINYLDPLSPNDCEQMIRSLGHQVKLEYSQQAIDLIYEAGGGHPFITRQICSLAFSQMKQPGQVPLELLQHVIEEFIYDPDTASLLNRDGLWGSITEAAIWGRQEARAQGDLLRFLASECDPRPIIEFVQGKNSASKRAAIQELKNLHIIKEVAPGHYDIAFGCFKNWIQEWQL